MYIYVYICVYIYRCMCIYLYLSIYTSVSISLSICVYTHIYQSKVLTQPATGKEKPHPSTTTEGSKPCVTK